MASKRLPPLIGGIEQASVVDDETPEQDSEEDLDEGDDPDLTVFWVSWDGQIDQA